MLESDLGRAERLQGYTSRRRYFMRNQRFHKSAESLVRMSYRRPDHKEFVVESRTGSRIVHQKVFERMMEAERRAAGPEVRRRSRITPENYDFAYAGLGEDRGRKAHLFDISPKTSGEFLIRGRIWIDAGDFAISRIEGRPARNPSFWVRSTRFVHLFQKVGPFWLADTNTSETEVRVFGRTTVDIRYSEYRLDHGED